MIDSLRTSTSDKSITDYLSAISESTQPTGDSQYAIFIFAFMVVALILGGLFVYFKFGRVQSTEQQSVALVSNQMELRLALLEEREKERETQSRDFREETRTELKLVSENIQTIMVQMAIIMEKIGR